LTLHLLSVTKTSEFETAQIKLDRVAEKARAVGFSPILQVSQGETEKVIEQYIQKQDIHLLLMGAYGHTRIRHLVIGSTTAQMLRNSVIPVLLFR
jgi:nucleotide-binding universal stress UspA family protein